MSEEQDPTRLDGTFAILGFLLLACVAFVGGCVVSSIMDSVK